MVTPNPRSPLPWAAAVIACCLAGPPAGCDDEPPDADADADLDADADAEAFEIDPARILADVATLASDAMEGRATLAPGNEAALDLVEGLFVELGLEPAGTVGYRQPFPVDAWSLFGPPSAALGGAALDPATEIEVVQYSGSGAVEAAIVFAGYGITVPPYDRAAYPGCPVDPVTGYDDYAGVDASGRVVLVLRHGPGDDPGLRDACPGGEACTAPPCLWYLGYKAANARRHGAAAVIVVQDFRHGPGAIAGATLQGPYAEGAIPVAFVHRDRVEAALPDLEPWAGAIDAALSPASVATGVTASLAIEAEVVRGEASNVLGSVRGADPALAGEVVVVGAHVDHLGVDVVTGDVFNGADDDASGVAVMLELARAMAREAPARTILFAAWNAEESGVVGSCAYVDEPTSPIDSTVAAFAVEMVGAGDGSGLALTGTSEPDLAFLAATMRAGAAAAGLDAVIASPAQSEASDHACFARRGVAATCAYGLGPHPLVHTPDDDLDAVAAESLGLAARLLWAGLLPLAMGTEAAGADTKRRSAPAPAPLPPPRDPPWW